MRLRGAGFLSSCFPGSPRLSRNIQTSFSDRHSDRRYIISALGSQGCCSFPSMCIIYPSTRWASLIKRSSWDLKLVCQTDCINVETWGRTWSRLLFSAFKVGLLMFLHNIPSLYQLAHSTIRKRSTFRDRAHHCSDGGQIIKSWFMLIWPSSPHNVPSFCCFYFILKISVFSLLIVSRVDLPRVCRSCSVLGME